jgi:hypothetical protein
VRTVITSEFGARGATQSGVRPGRYGHGDNEAVDTSATEVSIDEFRDLAFG